MDDALSSHLGGPRFGPGLRHNLVFGRGMASDDTELACFTAQAFLAHPADASGFAAELGWKLRLWFLGVPHASAVEKSGIGPLAVAWPLIPVRNAVFLSILLAHGLRRLLPVYR